MTGILDLPVELLLLIFPYLDATSFLNLTSTCKALHKPEFRHEPSYWSLLVRQTFRVPNQPVVEQDGERWQKLFKRMLTQSRIYTWGNNEKACLGHSYNTPLSPQDNHGQRRIDSARRRHISWPGKMQGVAGLGVISDLQCGGWSTTLLNAKGALYTVGVIDGLTFNHRLALEPEALKYPPGFPPPRDRYEPSTAVRQFSSGRAHILALTDSGRIWTWHNVDNAALHVKFLHHDTVENGKGSGKGVIKKVVAGWNKSAALIEGTGIVLWEPLRREREDTSIADAALVLETVVVPNTEFRKSISKVYSQVGDGDATDADSVGEVINFIVLEEVVLFNTHLGKVFAARIVWDNNDQRISVPVEIPLPSEKNDEIAFATDVQGSFKSFAIFTHKQSVFTSNQDRLQELLETQPYEGQLFTRIPALQQQNVIQLAFGDYHFHALHSAGYITSYGTEPQHCGALGLGKSNGEGRLRGLRYQNRGDARLVPHAYTEGRRIWFEREKRTWIEFLISGGVDPAESMERERMAIGSPGIQCHGEVSEWIEQEGRDWEKKLGVQAEDDDGLGAYFAMSVTAAGWHSGALVLVNQELAEKLKRACEIPDGVPTPKTGNETSGSSATESGESEGIISWLVNSAIAVGSDYGRWFLGLPPYNVGATTHTQDSASTEQMENFRRGTHPINYGASPRVGLKYIWADDHFPRLRLSDGITEMPGMVPFDDWRYPRPDWDLEFTL